MLYHLHELNRAALMPTRAMAQATWVLSQTTAVGPVAFTSWGRAIGATADVVERMTRRYEVPPFGLDTVEIDGRSVAVTEEVLSHGPFGTLRRFRRHVDRDDPRVLVVSPLSGYPATVMRDTIRALLPDHDVLVTDWVNARDMPKSAGPFGMDEQIDAVIDYLRVLGPGTHVLSFSQSSVPALAAAAIMAEDDDPCEPASLVLIAGAVDARINPTPVMRAIPRRPLGWYNKMLISRVPFGYQGAGRRVFPGFLLLGTLMGFDITDHMRAVGDYWRALLRGDELFAEAHRRVYDDLFAVVDVPGELYLDTIRTVFQDYALARGRMTWRGRTVDATALHRTALMTVEAERDALSPAGQTAAAQGLCPNIPSDRRAHWEQPGVGHFNIAQGRRWRQEIYPRVRTFIRAAA